MKFLEGLKKFFTRNIPLKLLVVALAFVVSIILCAVLRVAFIFRVFWCRAKTATAGA